MRRIVAGALLWWTSVLAAPHGGMGGMGGMGMRASNNDPSCWKTPSAWETDPDKLCLPLTCRQRGGERVPPDALESCQAEAATRLEQRRAALPSMRREDLEAIPEQFLIEEERTRIAELVAADMKNVPAERRPLTRDELRIAREERSARSRDLRWLRPAWSAAYCTYAEMSRTALVHKRDETEQARARDYQRSMKTIATSLSQLGALPLPCTDSQTVKIRDCLKLIGKGAACASELSTYVQLVPAIYP